MWSLNSETSMKNIWAESKSESEIALEKMKKKINFSQSLDATKFLKDAFAWALCRLIH